MKLPQAYRTGTNVSGSLGRDTGPTFAEAKLREGDKGFLGTGLTSKDFGVMAQTAMNITNMQGKRQQQQANLKMQEAEARFQDQYGGKDYFEIDEIPNEFVTDDMLARGTRVPSYEVMPQIYNEYMSLSLEQASEGIATAGFRNDWITSTKEIQTNRQMKMNMAAMENAQRQIIKDQTADITRLIKERRPDLAIPIIEEMDISNNARLELKNQVSTATEIIEYEDLIIAQDLNGMQQAVTRLRQPEDEYKKDGTLDTTSRITWIGKLESQINNIQRQNQASLDYNKDQIKRQIKITQSNALDGKATDPEEINELLDQVRTINALTNGDLQNEYDNLVNSLYAFEANNHMVKANRFERPMIIDSIYENPLYAKMGSFEKDQLVLRLEQSHQAQIAAENEDLMQSAIDTKAIQELVPIQLGPQAPEQMAARLGQYEVVKQRYGDVGKGPLTKSEAMFMSGALSNMTANQQLSFLSANADVMGADANIFYDQLRTDGTAASLAIAGVAANNGDINGAEAILRGAEYRRENPEMVTKLKPLMDLEFQQKVGNTYFGNPSQEAAVREAVMDAYIHYARAAGKDLTSIEKGGLFWGEDLYQKALVTGTGGYGVISQGSATVPAPVPGLPQKTWDDWMRNLDSSYISELGGVHNATDQSVLYGIQNGDFSLEAKSNNEYYIKVNETQNYLGAKDGGMFIFRYEPSAPIKSTHRVGVSRKPRTPRSRQ